MEILPVQLNLTFRERDKFCETEPLCITIKSVSVFSLVQPQRFATVFWLQQRIYTSKMEKYTHQPKLNYHVYWKCPLPINPLRIYKGEEVFQQHVTHESTITKGNAGYKILDFSATKWAAQLSPQVSLQIGMAASLPTHKEIK